MGPPRLWRTTSVTQSRCLWAPARAGCPVLMTACRGTGAPGAIAAWWGFKPDQKSAQLPGLERIHQHEITANPTLMPLAWQKYSLSYDKEFQPLQTWETTFLMYLAYIVPVVYDGKYRIDILWNVQPSICTLTVANLFKVSSLKLFLWCFHL